MKLPRGIASGVLFPAAEISGCHAGLDPEFPFPLPIKLSITHNYAEIAYNYAHIYFHLEAAIDIQFVTDELKHLKPMDKRIARRINIFLAHKVLKPDVSIPQAFGSTAAVKAAYRLLSNKSLEPMAIMNAHIKRSAERICGLKMALVAHDTTDIDFSSHKKVRGVGYLDAPFCRGIKLHTSLALSPEGVPLGVVYQKAWARDDAELGKRAGRHKKPIEEKESYRWIEGMRSARAAVDKSVTLIHIADREGDIYEFISETLKLANNYPLVRACHDRMTLTSGGGEARLFEAIASVPVAGEMKVHIARRGPERLPETVVCQIRFAPCALQPPIRKKDQPALPLWVASAEEKGGGEGAIKWVLLCGAPVNSLEDAISMVGYYARRWLIERFHYTLKSGCRVEELQLEEADRLMRALELYSIAAFRLLWITYSARADPDGPSSLIISDRERKLLVGLLISAGAGRMVAKGGYGLLDCVTMIACLGGFMGRKSDGFPGVKTLWRGLRRLEEACETMESLEKLGWLNKEVVGNG